MSDHEFEKQVQRKMGELKLRPSDAVWTEVEKSIRHDKRRRRFIFWLPVFFLFLATSGYVLYTTRQPSTPIAQSTTGVDTKTSSASSNKNAHNENNSTSVTIKENDPLKEEPAAGPALPPANNPSATTITEAQSQQPPKQQPVATPGQQNGQTITAPQPAEVTPWPEATETTIAKRTKVNKAGHPRYNATKNGNSPKRYKNKTVPSEPDQAAGFNLTENNTTGNNTLTEQSNGLTATMPQTVPQEGASIETGQAAPQPFDNRAAKLLMPEKQNSPAPVPPIQKQKGPKWQWGVQFNAGYSRISTSSLLNLKGLLGAEEKNKLEDLASSAPRSGFQVQYNNAINRTDTVKKAAPIQPDLAYSLGVFVQRPLSKRLRLTIGLQYTYMSAHTTVGKLMEKTTNVNYGTTGSTFVSEYYTSMDYKDTAQPALNYFPGLNAVPRDSSIAQRYTFRFHAIELPVLINWQINKGRRLPPLVLDAGFSILHLRSIDALHYDGIQDIYYKDNSLFNQTQFNALVGLNVGLFQQSKLPVWVGPNLRYSLTGLVKNEVSKGQFLWSAGMNVRVGLNRLF